MAQNAVWALHIMGYGVPWEVAHRSPENGECLCKKSGIKNKSKVLKCVFGYTETLWKTRATGLSSEETIAAFTDFIKSVDFSESDILKIITVWLRSHKQEFMRLRQEKSKQVRDELYRRKREKRSRSCPRLVFC